MTARECRCKLIIITPGNTETRRNMAAEHCWESIFYSVDAIIDLNMISNYNHNSQYSHILHRNSYNILHRPSQDGIAAVHDNERPILGSELDTNKTAPKSYHLLGVPPLGSYVELRIY
ncbi:unnamed protein product, partial [Brenthis ino]